MTKQQIYRAVERYKQQLAIEQADYPLDLVDLCQQRHWAALALVPFKTPLLRGMAVPSDDPEHNDVILLNGCQTREECNFYCGHELIHLGLHRNRVGQTFSCYETVMPNQNRYVEWQANEGGAELLVPYRLLFPALRARAKELNAPRSREKLAQQLADEFFVSPAVMRVRFQSLQYELWQYCRGIAMDDLEFLSRQEQRIKGIDSSMLTF